MIDIIPKLPNWQARLDLFIAASTRTRFRPGEHDCALFGSSVHEAQTGVDFAAPFRGQYSTLEEGLKLLQDAGYQDHIAFTAAHLNEIPVSFARVGDIAAVDFGDAGMGLTVVAGHRLIGPMMNMRGNLPLTDACRAFSVGWKLD